MPGLAEIAEAAGVSISTVSRVLNRRAGVNEETRQRVLEALSQINYTPRGLGVLRRTGVLGLLVPELANPVFTAFAEAVETRAARKGYSTVLCNTHSASVREEEYVRMLNARGVEGMVFVSSEFTDSTAAHDHYGRLRDEGVRMVFVNGTLPSLDVPSVSVDEEAAGYLATQHLLELGHRRIGFVAGPARSTPTKDKTSGYTAALEAAGLRPDAGLIAHSAYGTAGGQQAMRRLLDRAAAPTAVICSSDLMALGAIHECQSRGLHVPDDVSVVGFDDIPLASYVVPTLTTLAQPIADLARMAVEVLLGEIEGTAEPTSARTLRPRLVVRESTAPPPRT
jgi:DNA-binding LacI/PurR family transcriptional regulator